ncbi:MAG: hypothetical protein JNL58_18090 [Planctomyces sp.]|nr:hypothetical protein [Planctomyces sp.]
MANSVDLVAEEAAEKLHGMGIEPARTTFIGESFGNRVNARVAEHLGRRGKFLAFNPPNAAGGYRMPDLRVCADLTWSFHTFSVFDTQDAVAHAGFLLETDAETTERDQHTSGIPWLVSQVRSGNMSWLLMQHKTVVARDEEFDGIATVSGKLLSDDRPLRQRPHENTKNSRTRMPVVTTSL